MSQTTPEPVQAIETAEFAGLEVAEVSTFPSDAELDQAWQGDYGLSTSGQPQDLYTLSPEFEMVGAGRNTGLQANYDFLQSKDPLMQSVLNSTMIDSISLDGSYLANMPAMTHESGMSYEERNSLDPEAYHYTAEIPKGGDNFNQLYSKFIGVHAVDAAEYYVDQRIKSDNPLWGIPAGLALLATPENAGKTGLVLGGAGIASAFMTAYRAAGVLGVAEEGALITAETASGMPLVRRWDYDVPNNKVVSLNPNEIRFSQDSVSYLKQRPGQASYTLDDLTTSMRTQGWKGDPVDVVRLPDGTFSSIDNTRILAAREAGIDVQANVRAYNERLPDSMLDRFEHPKVPRGYAQTWGEALEYRILRQNKTFQNNNYPVGSYQDPKVKYNVKNWFQLD